MTREAGRKLKPDSSPRIMMMPHETSAPGFTKRIGLHGPGSLIHAPPGKIFTVSTDTDIGSYAGQIPKELVNSVNPF